MNNRKSSRRLLYLSIFLLGCGVCHAQTLRQKLQTALGQYCIPKEEGGCESIYRANYNSSGPASNKCECSCKDSYYDTAARKCVSCADTGSDGSFATSCKSAPSCPSGTYRKDVSSGCPANTYALSVSDWSCEHGLGEPACPSNNYRMTW